MPRANPKNPKIQSKASRYYHRNKTAFHEVGVHRDRIVYVYLVAFIGIIGGALLLSYFLLQPHKGPVVTIKGDTVNLTYTLKYDNGTLVQKGSLTKETIGNDDLLPYFDQELIGVIAGHSKSFTVPAIFGYTSSMGQPKLVGQNLDYVITITSVVRDGKTLYP
jgi:hypothetical protein